MQEKNYKTALSIGLKQEIEKNKGKELSKSPVNHQIKAHEKMSAFFNEDGKRGILVIPTGGGKTYTSVHWLLRNVIAKNKKVLWLADQSFLLEQAFDEFLSNMLLIKANQRQEIILRLISGNTNHANQNSIKTSDDILFMTAQTAISAWNDKSLNDNGKLVQSPFKKFIEANASENELFIVYDEAHHTPAFERRNLLIGGSEGKIGIIEKYPKVNLLGLTATPTHTDKNKKGWLWEIFKGGEIYKVEKKELEDAGFLAFRNDIQQETNFSFVISDKDIEKMIIKHTDLPANIITEIAKNEDRNQFIAELYCKNRNFYGKTIIFVDRWYQCKTIEKYINQKAGKNIAASVFSYVDKNKDIDYINNRKEDQNSIYLNAFKDGKLEVLLNVRMLTEGVDVPDVKTVFITRETNSTILFTQMIGRALRGEKAGGKKTTANIVYFTDNWNRHIEFGGPKTQGGVINNPPKPRDYPPYELIGIDLIEKLQFEYEKGTIDVEFIEMIPIGWYVVSYTDTLTEEIEEGQVEKSIETFTDNILILEKEQKGFREFIENYEKKHKANIWEHEELNETETDLIIDKLISEYFPEYTINTKAIKVKLRRIARHLGQQRTPPEFYTFEQRKDLDLRPHVLKIREDKLGREQAEQYLEHIYNSTSNPFFKVIFYSFEDFYDAYNYEDNVYRKFLKGTATISGSQIESETIRLLPEKIREIVFKRDENTCVCCGRKSGPKIDHIFAFKNTEPKDDIPELYQTLCSICNSEKATNEFNYLITNYQMEKIKVRDVKKSSDNEDIEYYFARLINCYFATNAVVKDSLEVKNSGAAIWKLKLKPTSDLLNPKEILEKDLPELEKIIRTKGFKFKKIRIE